MGAVIASLSMMSIMSLLLYYNLYAQSQEGLGLSPLEAGASLLPLCVALLALAISASSIAARAGLRATIMVGMVLVVIGSAALGAATLMAETSKTVPAWYAKWWPRSATSGPRGCRC